MGMGIVSDAEFQKEVEKSIPVDTIVDAEVIEEKSNRGRKEGDNNVPNSLRKLIGVTSVIEGRPEAIDVAKSFGLSESSVSAYANGSTSTTSMRKQPNLKFLNTQRMRISRKASRLAVKALDTLSETDLTNTKPEILATVAKTMSAIVKEMEPETPKDGGDKPQTQFVVFAPQLHQENHYPIVMAKDEG